MVRTPSAKSEGAENLFYYADEGLPQVRLTSVGRNRGHARGRAGTQWAVLDGDEPGDGLSHAGPCGRRTADVPGAQVDPRQRRRGELGLPLRGGCSGTPRPDPIVCSERGSGAPSREVAGMGSAIARRFEDRMVLNRFSRRRRGGAGPEPHLASHLRVRATRVGFAYRLTC